MPRVDRAALKVTLEQYRIHEHWLGNRIAPAWARVLEARWRRREIANLVFFTLVVSAFLINGGVVFVSEFIAGTLSVSVLPGALFGAAFLLWVLRALVKNLGALGLPVP